MCKIMYWTNKKNKKRSKNNFTSLDDIISLAAVSLVYYEKLVENNKWVDPKNLCMPHLYFSMDFSFFLSFFFFFAVAPKKIFSISGFSELFLFPKKKEVRIIKKPQTFNSTIF